jgi:vacuolar-type H+-ATPase subunit F/Vma7
MKKVLLGAILLFSTLGFSQTITFDEISKSTEKIKTKFTEYQSKDCSIYKIGDKIKIGFPSSNKTFAFITEGDGLLLPITQLNASKSGQDTEIKNFFIMGTKRSGFYIVFRTKSQLGLPGGGYTILFENAIESGEIKSFGFSSDEALAELKKLKDKLDLGIISVEEFDIKKNELKKFIK